MSHILIVEAPYYEDVAEKLREGVTSVLEANNDRFEFIQVTGALEIPAAIKFAASQPDTGRPLDSYDGFIALGCVIRGATSHYDIVCEQSAAGLMDLSIQHNLAIGNGILTCDTKQQAIERADPAQKDRGGHAARAVLQMIEIKEKFS